MDLFYYNTKLLQILSYFDKCFLRKPNIGSALYFNSHDKSVSFVSNSIQNENAK